MRVVSGPADVKVGDLVEFDPEPTKPEEWMREEPA